MIWTQAQVLEDEAVGRIRDLMEQAENFAREFDWPEAVVRARTASLLAGDLQREHVAGADELEARVAIELRSFEARAAAWRGEVATRTSAYDGRESTEAWGENRGEGRPRG